MTDNKYNPTEAIPLREYSKMANENRIEWIKRLKQFGGFKYPGWKIPGKKRRKK